MGTAAGMLQQAVRLLGTTEQPPGSNRNFITKAYGFDDAWCEMTVWYASHKSDNVGAMFGKFAHTVTHAKVFGRHGRWHYGLGGARPGDIVYFDWSGTRSIDRIDHVGIIEAVHADGTITTIEGNTDNACRRRRRNATCVVGYGRPAYGDAAPMPAGDGILRRGSIGEAVRTLQRQLNTVNNAGLTVDGQYGPRTTAAVKAFQRQRGLTPDGEYGPHSAAAMRAALAGHSAPIPPVPRPSGSLAVDGKPGPATWAAVQRALNAHGAQLTVDGIAGPQTARALQRYLRETPDGIIGPRTIAALQRKVGAPVSRVLDAPTVRALQQALNQARF